MPIFELPADEIIFPNPELAEPIGVLAVGGDLSPERVLFAYQHGIFPWFNPDEPIYWWSPDPRMVLLPAELKVARSMRPYFNQSKFRLTLDTAFDAVIGECRSVYREGQRGSWITRDMVEAYTRLHHLGHVHSVEVWEDDRLVGGLYGVSLGRVFFGESMFTRVSNASKFAFIRLVRLLAERQFQLVDCQQVTPHLATLGARPVSRKEFLKMLRENPVENSLVGSWKDWVPS
jgi:leucyl/phenylalanyl-tRNA--protein transferase